MKTLITNVTVLTMNADYDIFEKGFILFEDDRILTVGPVEQQPNAGYDRMIDGRNAIAMPGMVNTHTHIGMIPFRSLGDDTPDRLRRFLFPLEKACMTKDLAYHSGKYAIAEMQLAGVTTFMDMYYFEDELAQAADEMQARAILGETVIDFATCDTSEPHGGLSYAETFIPKWLDHELITPAIAPHAPNTNSPQALQEAAAISKKYGVPISLHLSEMDYEIRHFQEKYGKTPVAFLADLGVLSERLIAAHCIHVTPDDITLLKQNDVAVAHCIGANTKSAKGVAPVKAMLEAGIRVGLGTDGPSSGNTLDLFVQMRMFANFHKTHLQDRAAFPARDIVRLATLGGAEVLGLADKIGSLETGKKADIVLVETDSANMFPIFDPYAVLVYSAHAGNVSDVFINGVPIVSGKQLLTQDLAALKTTLASEMKDFIKQAEQNEKKTIL
ncbi:MAG: amidohydrolase [Trichococcus flocculiformis]|jgi:5-methylthioadenosine/S-adenosylhomocysteine deaminase